MLWYRTEKAIIEQWQADTAYSLEAGGKPILNLGSSNTTLDGLLGIRALQKMNGEQENIVQPLVAMGGQSSLWLFVLLQTTRIHSNSRPNDEQPYSNRTNHFADEPDIIFTASDPATHIAALTTQSSASQSSASRINSANIRSPKVRWTGLDIGMSHLFAPASEPGANSPIESLPFTIEPVRTLHHLNRYTQANTLTNQSATHHSSSSTTPDEQTIWTARAMIGVAILMVITALLI